LLSEHVIDLHLIGKALKTRTPIVANGHASLSLSYCDVFDRIYHLSGTKTAKAAFFAAFISAANGEVSKVDPALAFLDLQVHKWVSKTHSSWESCAYSCSHGQKTYITLRAAQQMNKPESEDWIPYQIHSMDYHRLMLLQQYMDKEVGGAKASNFARTLDQLAHEVLLKVVDTAKGNKNIHDQLLGMIGSKEVNSISLPKSMLIFESADGGGIQQTS
jgi:hypothetical protein